MNETFIILRNLMSNPKAELATPFEIVGMENLARERFLPDNIGTVRSKEMTCLEDVIKFPHVSYQVIYLSL